MSMKHKFVGAFLLLGVLFISTSFRHPLKLTTSMVTYDPGSKTLKMECRVFIDDFENSINRTLSKDINVSNLTKADKAGLERYFAERYAIRLNGKIIPLKYLSSKVLRAENVFSIKFTKGNVKFKKGDKLTIKNVLFCKEFGMNQTNRITVQIPPYIPKESNICNERHTTLKFQL